MESYQNAVPRKGEIYSGCQALNSPSRNPRRAQGQVSKDNIGLYEIPNVPKGLCLVTPPGTYNSQVLLTLISLCFSSLSVKYLLITQLCCRNKCVFTTHSDAIVTNSQA